MKGTVAAGHELTARAGAEMLERGGTAFDAALAAAFASFVCEPAITSAGGGGFFMAMEPGREPVVYDFFSTVPGLGVPGLGGGGEVEKDFFPVSIDFASATQELLIGRASAAVPGTMAGLKEVHEKHCRLELTEIVAPAVRYASEGIRLTPHQASFIKILGPILDMTEEGRRVFAPGGRPLRVGDTMRNRDMADSFEYLAGEGLDKFYEGEVARKVCAGFGAPRGGLITDEDLRQYGVAVRDPLKVDYRGREVFTNPPPSTGGALVAFSLKLLGLSEAGEEGHNTGPYLRLLLEVMKTVDEARGAEFDGGVSKEGVSSFLSDETVAAYGARLSSAVDSAAAVGRGGGGMGNTTHISVVDEEGAAASVTTSSGIGGGVMIPDTGIMMNNFLGEEDLNPGGYHMSEPGRRISSMMSPVIVTVDGRPELVLGSGGSKRIRNVLVQAIVNLIDHSMGVKEAVGAARVHWDGAVLQAEPGVEEAALDELRKAGVAVNRWSETDMYFGGVNAVCADGAGGAGGYTGAGDPRRGGACIKV